MNDWSRTAFVFPGQGSQHVGMGKDVAEAFREAHAVFEEADALMGFAFSKLCFEGPEDALNDTINTQPALYVCSLALLRALQTRLPDARPVYMAGHSLGELTALAAAGVLTFGDGLRLVRERGRLMKMAGEQNPGAMAALLGLDAAPVHEICARASLQTGRQVVVANDNCPGQVVISGHDAALEVAMELAREAGAKRTVKLAVSIAAHSPLMEVAAGEFRRALDETTFQQPKLPIMGNVDAAPLRDVTEIRQELDRQLTQPVRWTESVRAMILAGVERFVEVGPGDVLTGLLKRIDRSKQGLALNNAAALQQLMDRSA